MDYFIITLHPRHTDWRPPTQVDLNGVGAVVNEVAHLVDETIRDGEM